VSTLCGHERAIDLHHDLLTLSRLILWQFDHGSRHTLDVPNVLTTFADHTTNHRLWNLHGSSETNILVPSKSFLLEFLKDKEAGLLNKIILVNN
jgi:hypothetical protein